MTTRRTDGGIVELEELLLELERLLLELDDEDPPDELLLDEGRLELLDPLLVEDPLLLDGDEPEL